MSSLLFNFLLLVLRFNIEEFFEDEDKKDNSCGLCIAKPSFLIGLLIVLF